MFFLKIFKIISLIVILLSSMSSSVSAEVKPSGGIVLPDYLPLRLVAEAAGYEVQWVPKGTYGNTDNTVDLFSSRHNASTGYFIIVDSRSYVRADAIDDLLTDPVVGGIATETVKVSEGIYRISVKMGGGGGAPKIVEQAFISRIDKDRASIVIFSDGDNKITLIEITVNVLLPKPV